MACLKEHNPPSSSCNSARTVIRLPLNLHLPKLQNRTVPQLHVRTVYHGPAELGQMLRKHPPEHDIKRHIHVNRLVPCPRFLSRIEKDDFDVFLGQITGFPLRGAEDVGFFLHTGVGVDTFQDFLRLVA